MSFVGFFCDIRGVAELTMEGKGLRGRDVGKLTDRALGALRFKRVGIEDNDGDEQARGDETEGREDTRAGDGQSQSR